MAYHRHHKLGVLGGLIFGVIFAAVGYGVAFFLGKPIVDKAKGSEHWPSVEGRIVSSEVQRHRDSKGKVTYSADVSYDYEVNGEKRMGDTVWFGNFSSSNSGLARETVAKYPRGASVRVYYSPENPDVSVLEPGAFWSSYIAYGIGLLFLGVGALVLGGIGLKLLFVMLAAGAVLGNSLAPDDSASAGQVAVPSTPPHSSPTNQDADDGIRIG